MKNVVAISLALVLPMGGAAAQDAIHTTAADETLRSMPTDDFTGQWWVHPSGCEYSRAGRPGEVVWYVIINSVGRRNCPVMIVQKARPGAYSSAVEARNRMPGGLF